MKVAAKSCKYLDILSLDSVLETTEILHKIYFHIFLVQSVAGISQFMSNVVMKLTFYFPL